MPAKTMAKVSMRLGAERTRFRNAVDISPLASVIPIPSKATSTVPKGAKPVKLVTMLVMIKCMPCTVIRLTGSITSPVPGWITEKLKS
jgi:hypothetical protein